jgi:hypothetical protein
MHRNRSHWGILVRPARPSERGRFVRVEKGWSTHIKGDRMIHAQGMGMPWIAFRENNGEGGDLWKTPKE